MQSSFIDQKNSQTNLYHKSRTSAQVNTDSNAVLIEDPSFGRLVWVDFKDDFEF